MARVPTEVTAIAGTRTKTLKRSPRIMPIAVIARSAAIGKNVHHNETCGKNFTY
jgi:hypothetical protein